MLVALPLTSFSLLWQMGAGSPAGSDSESNASPTGIVQGHAYAILDIKPADKFKLIRLRNPWGRKEVRCALFCSCLLFACCVLACCSLPCLFAVQLA